MHYVKIYEGIYKDGKKIPSERQLSTDYEVSRITVRESTGAYGKGKSDCPRSGKWNTGDIEKLWKCKSFGCCGAYGTIEESFFCNFIAEFQKQAWEKNTLLLYVEVPERATLEDCLYRRDTRNIRNVVVWQDDQTVERNFCVCGVLE